MNAAVSSWVLAACSWASRAAIWHARRVRERQIDRVVAVAVAAVVLVLIGLVAALGFLVGWLPAAILFAAVVAVVFLMLVAN
jgi:hypothetical protein